ncbi:MAG: phosphate ABC transporter substrate-binding protein PstS [Ignavibacteria bacterium]|nr:phosphate ABC transporter substrate-binding protein PstS [Ignavibacteria bacterium]
MRYIAILLLSITFFSCGGKRNVALNRSGGQLNGAGATFPFPIYSKWFDEYYKIDKNAKINYQSIGSGGGIRQITEGTVDFGASDSPMNDTEKKKAEDKNNSRVLQIPTVLGAVVLTYNLPGINKNINLSGETIADIYLGKIKRWNDGRIKADNPDINFPDKEIVVCYRTDGSGTTYIYTDFLSKVSPEWKQNQGTAKDVRFPVGQGGKGNEGVTGIVKQLEYSIGYIELIYALQNKLNYANVKNKEGEFISPSLESVTKAADNTVDEMTESLTLSVTNAKGKGAYPIASYTYLLVLENQRDLIRGRILKSFIKWALTDGKKFANDLGYSSLPESVVAKALQRVELINFNGKPL